MKTILLCISLIVMSYLQLQASVFIAIKNGKWHDGFTWDQNRIPCLNDTIVIPDGVIVSLTENLRILGIGGSKGKLFNFGELKLTKKVAVILNEKSWINCFENGKLTGNKDAKIIINEQIIFRFSKNHEQYKDCSNSEMMMLERITIRLNDTLLADFSIKHNNIAFIEIQHSYNGYNWQLIDRIKAVQNEKYLYRFISIKKIKKKDNFDFIRMIGYSMEGKPMLLSITRIKIDAAKEESLKKNEMLPKHLFMFGIASFVIKFGILPTKTNSAKGGF